MGQKGGKNIDEIECIVLILLLYCIWTARYQKKISYAKIENNMVFLFQGIIQSSVRLKQKANNCVSLWCRTWRGAVEEQGDGVQHGHG